KIGNLLVFRQRGGITVVTNFDGLLVDEGNAQPDSADCGWIFTATRNNDSLEGDKIEIYASDIPGNITGDAYFL
ncbi:MAG: hypothetical protein LBI27_02155, partial [Clostridiales bacterium]|nr:hypothetical protein [Clostridiales bacterium]